MEEIEKLLIQEQEHVMALKGQEFDHLTYLEVRKSCFLESQSTFLR